MFSMKSQQAFSMGIPVTFSFTKTYVGKNIRFLKIFLNFTHYNCINRTGYA